MAQLDLGDLVLSLEARVKGRSRRKFRLHVGVPFDSTPDQRVVHGHPSPIGRADFAMDLQADKQVALSPEWTDEVGNPTEGPTDAVVAYSVDDPTVINLTDNGDGSAVAAAVGALGTANVHAEASFGGEIQTADLQIVVVAGLAERFNIAAGEPTEITPD